MGELTEKSPPEDSPTINSSLASLTIGGHNLPKKLQLSCFHAAGTESIRAEFGKSMERDIVAFYDEAIRRLPVADMPELVDCVLTGGHCIGLLDPVSNIIFNALNLRCRRMCSGDSARPRSGRMEKERKKKVPSLGSKGAAGKGEVAKSFRWFTLVFRSYSGLIAFVQTYFRYLSAGQAMRYLRVAGADLAVAVQLGEHQHFGLEGRQTPDLCCGRTQYALKAAAAKAEHPEPNDLALLAKSLVTFKDQKPLAAVLQKGRLLSVEDVNGILGSLQRLHYAASPAVQVSFTRRPHPDFHQQPSKFSCVVGENYIADVAITRYDGPISSICDLRTPDEMKQLLFDCLDFANTTIGNCCPSSHTARNPATAPPSDTTKCEHISYLKKCLLDAIHAFYIEALSLLPHKSLHKHLRGILVAGHCYGPLDPVSNIILNAFCKSMLRVEVRSLNGLVAMFCTATGLSEHDAVEYLCHKQCDLSVVLQMTSKEICFKAYDHAGQAGKHPKHSDLASFLVSMYGADVQGLLRASLTNYEKTKGYVISDASLELVYKVVGGQSSLTAPSVDRPRLSPMGWKMLASRKCDFVQKQGLLRKILEKLLLDYSNQHPWEPMHRLDVICGVKERNYEHSKCYHLNFLAYCDDASSNATSTTRVLFFAEVWGPKTKRSELDTSAKMVPVPCTANGHHTDSNSHAKIYCKSGQVKSRTSFCCPLPYYNVDHPYLGRCNICEPSSSKIAHPPSGNHAGAKCSEIGASADYLNFVEPASSVDCITDSDFMYFDCFRDVKFAEILNAKRL
ncbi:unnamed protein product [Urochloa decumbens]|uniref:Uncharacterized protein n=1 Tax=Urochloa decumbens TaxID=240449 RepID=A0ABC8WDW8_9POAL